MAFDVKITTFPGLIDLVCPHYCRGCNRLGSPVCNRCKNYIIRGNLPGLCPNCGGSRAQLFRGGFATTGATPARSPVTTGATKRPEKQSEPGFLSYKTRKVPKHECPFCHFPVSYVVGKRDGLLGDLISDYKYNSTRALSLELAKLLNVAIYEKLPGNTIIVPLPTTSRHIRSRGLDHTYLLAKNLAKLRGLKVEKLLLRAKNTVQVGSSSKKRQEQALEAYKINEKLKIDDTATYLLLDDVWTTGASMRAAVERLRDAGVDPKHIRVALLATNR